MGIRYHPRGNYYESRLDVDAQVTPMLVTQTPSTSDHLPAFVDCLHIFVYKRMTIALSFCGAVRRMSMKMECLPQAHLISIQLEEVVADRNLFISSTVVMRVTSITSLLRIVQRLNSPFDASITDSCSLYHQETGTNSGQMP
ncbi:hypothetical protein CHS0354_015461 [Potamilus streckersoni]|uniref:Uncharacterized protein n=1 Tax=Potamilus streckersoni TaxID=2493646 RepID=A0AAE0RQT7_9BIVA|nr:hypothetical protein CHS0354_015461 [Potamilus streckersoni]